MSRSSPVGLSVAARPLTGVVLLGGDGGDRLDGHSGRDILGGGKGRDTLKCGGGPDTLLAAGGWIDVLWGGTGRDKGTWDRKDKINSVERRLR